MHIPGIYRSDLMKVKRERGLMLDHKQLTVEEFSKSVNY
jgi:hypothetical protein